MKLPVALAIVLIAAIAAQTQDNHTQAKAASCNKLPYRLGHLVLLNSTDLRSEERNITKKESKELSKTNSELRANCNAFVRTSPGQPVSTEVAFEVRRFAAFYMRCESFCGTEKDLSEQVDRELNEMMGKK